MDPAGLGWPAFAWNMLYWYQLRSAEVDYAGLGSVALGWAGLDLAGLHQALYGWAG